MNRNCVLATIIVLVLIAAWATACPLVAVVGSVFALGIVSLVRLVSRAGAGAGAGSLVAGGNESDGLTDYCGTSVSARELELIQEFSKRFPMSDVPANIDGLRRLRWHSNNGNHHNHHVGQRKLLMSEVDFLSNYARTGDTIVYAGAAPGTHMPLLASLFPNLRFKLYDPRKFKYSTRTPHAARIKTYQQFFLDKDALSFAGRDDVLFISDIRTGTDEVQFPSEEAVRGDMNLQRRWVELMQPRAAMLKFRLTYGESPDYEYFDGDVRLQAWAPKFSSETRLIATRPYTLKMYSSAEYDDKLYFYNKIIRMWATYDHGVPLKLVPGLDYCPSCALEVLMWNTYLGASRATPARVATLMNRTAAALSRSLDSKSHGKDPELLPIERCKSEPVT